MIFLLLLLAKKMMDAPFVRIEWNKYETALLVDAYEKVASGEVKRKDAISRLSERLRNRMILSGIEVSDKYRNGNGIAMQMSAIEYCMTGGEKGFENPSKMFVEVATMAMQDRPSYESLLKDAFDLYPEPVAPVVYEQGEELVFNFVRESEISNKLTLSQIKEVLSLRFPKGFRLKSAIDLKRFRLYFSDYTGKNYNRTDNCLTEDILSCGIVSGDKVFIPDRILSNVIKRDIAAFIEETFSSNRQFLYYQTLFKKFRDELLDSIIVDEKMLRAYLEYYYDEKWFFYRDYMACVRNVDIDINNEVADYVKGQGRAVNEEEVVEALRFLPEEDVRRSFNNQPTILLTSGRNQRFHRDLFVVTESELSSIADIIDTAIAQYEYIGASELLDDIRKTVPSLFANNSGITDNGIRKALANKFQGKYSFSNAIISAEGHGLSAKEALLSYAKTHEEYTLAEIDSLADSLGTVLNYHLETLLEYSVRLNHDVFVSKDQVTFDVEAIDGVLEMWCSDTHPFLPLKSITNFTVFPEIQHPWTSRLLESFLITKSRKFLLLRGDYLNKNNLCGAIVRSDLKGLEDEMSMMRPFDILLSQALVQNHIPAIKENALDFLAQEGYIVQRRYAQIEQVLAKARSLMESNKN